MDENYEDEGENDKKDKIGFIRNKYGLFAHYHGDIARRLFVVASLIMLVTLPILNGRLHVSILVSILFIVVLVSFAGFVMPGNKWVIYADFTISAVSTVVFSYDAVVAYNEYSIKDLLFITDQVLAIIFLFALYYSAKTLRGEISK
jgi:hypothetical protein